jgi:uncharacterized protein YkwD
MRASALCFFLGVMSCATITPLPTPSTSPPTGGAPSGTGAASAIEADIVRYTNEARKQAGLAPLRLSAGLLDAARIHAGQMAEQNTMAHTISDARYPTLRDRLDAVGYAYANAAENIAWNDRTPQSVVSGWMNSPGHRANILNAQLTEIGATMARNRRGEPYWIQVFGRPR